jgi:exopolyphosphatase/guanosine-5'-triphosphate,3'-diphosphate pyrophosphatase
VIRALISIGTNSTRLLVLDGARRLAAESRGTRIGQGLGTGGALAHEARERTLAAIADYVAIARERGASEIDVIATSALRRAADSEAFGAEVAQLAGIEPRILSGGEEASFSFLGATATHSGTREIAVLDVGGGSTELAIDTPEHARASGSVSRTLSCEVGAVRLSERHPALLGAEALNEEERLAIESAARADAAGVLAAYAELRAVEELIVVGGTAFTAAAMVANGMRDGTPMTRADCAGLISALLARGLEERKRLPHIRPQRADILPAGLIVTDEACRLLGVDAFTVSESDLLLGYLTSETFRAAALPTASSVPGR